jgi:hypothetical protein
MINSTLMPWIFRTIVFLSAFILFQMELISTQRLLPHFGGSFQVWSTCLVFFNLVLLLGYAVVDYLGEKLLHHHYPKIHTFLVLASSIVFSLHIIPQSEGNALQSFWPIIQTLFLQIGIPFFLLSMTLPLAQIWCSKISMERSYNLYFYSGLGSVLGLISYPLVFNLFLGLSDHWILLRNLYLLLGFSFVPVIFFIKDKSHPISTEILSSKRNPMWILGSFVTCLLMLAVTNIVSQLIGSIPLVWIFPLLIYLLSFMLVFKPWFSERIINFSMLLWAALFMLCMIMESMNHKIIYFSLMILCLYSFLFIACTVVNHELYKIRPEGKTSHFNLYLNLGGLFATIFMSLCLPILGRYFKIQNLEVYLSLLFLTVFLFFRGFEKIKKASPKKLGLVTAVLALLIGTNFSTATKEIAYFRNFYNIIRLIDLDEHRLLVNGEILHGGQFLKSDKKNFPLHYYHPKAPFGDLMKILPPNKTVGIVGLGIGSMAYYAQPGEAWHFYEIDSDMEYVAKNYFTYLSNSKAETNISIGDGRLLLKNSQERFDLIVIDAFSGDAVPAHLITQEAIELYSQRLKNNDQSSLSH